VREVMHRTQRSVLDVCNALKELVEEGAVEIAPETSAGGPTETEATADEPERPVFDPEPASEAASAFETTAALEAVAPGDDTDVVTHVATGDAPTGIPEVATTPDPFAGAEDGTGPEVPGEAEAAAELDGAGEDGDPRDRGALLRLFSALRDQ
jgi:hypothetical protein